MGRNSPWRRGPSLLRVGPEIGSPQEQDRHLIRLLSMNGGSRRRTMKSSLLMTMAALGATCTGCDGLRESIDTHQRSLLESLMIGDPPPNPTNEFANDEGASRLGQKLFFDAR